MSTTNGEYKATHSQVFEADRECFHQTSAEYQTVLRSRDVLRCSEVMKLSRERLRTDLQGERKKLVMGYSNVICDAWPTTT